MKQVARAAGLLALTAAVLSLLGFLQPFARMSDLLDLVFQAAPRWTQVTWLFRDPAVMDISTGDRVLESMQKLEVEWARHPGAPRVVFLGNSQMQAISLAPGEPPPVQPEATYVDQVAVRLRQQPDPVLVYRLSAGGMTYTEALWCATALSANPRRRPDVIVMQINYQAFWLSGIRAGMVELLADESARGALQDAASQNTVYAPLFEGALQEFERQHQRRVAEVPVPGQGFGAALENRTRVELAAVSLFKDRHLTREEFLGLLYRLRLYVLRLKPSTARSITGTRLLRSRASLEALAGLCRRQGIRLVLLQAPLNPSVQLYRTEDDRLGYLGYVRDVAARYKLTVYDYETAIPAGLWGRWFNGPDPLHLGREAHRQLAERVEQLVRQEVLAR